MMAESEKPELEGMEHQQPLAPQSSDRLQHQETFDEPAKTGPGLREEQATNLEQTPNRATGSLSADPDASQSLTRSGQATDAPSTGATQYQPQARDVSTISGRFPAATRGYLRRLKTGLHGALRLMWRVPATGFVLVGALAAGFCVQWLVGGAETALDGEIAQPNVAQEMVTSLVWLADDQIGIGTASGAFHLHGIGDGRTVSMTATKDPIVGIAGLPMKGGVGTHGFFSVVVSANLTQKFEPGAPSAAPLRRVFLGTGTTDLEADDGLFAIGPGAPVPIVAGRRILPANQQQQQQMAPLTPVTGLFRYDVSADGKPREVGQVESLGNVRALAATPDGTFAVAGTDNGQVFAIDLLQTDLKRSKELMPFRIGTAGAAMIPPRSGAAVTRSPVVAVAAGGTISSPVIAAANADGLISVFKAIPDKPQQSLLVNDLSAFNYQLNEAGLPATNWHTQAIAGKYTLRTISNDGSRIVVSKWNAGTQAEEYFMTTINKDGAFSEPLRLPEPFVYNEGPITFPAMADAIYFGGAVSDVVRRAALKMASDSQKSGGRGIAAISVDRNRDAALIWMFDATVALVTVADPLPREIDLVNGLTPTAFGADGHMSQVGAINADGHLLATIGLDGQLNIYNLHQPSIVQKSKEAPSKLNMGAPSLSFSSDNRRIVVCNLDGSIEIYSATDLHLIRRDETQRTFSNISGCAGDFILRGTSERSFEMIATATGLPVLSADMGQPIEDMEVSGDGKTAAFSLADGSLRVWRKVDSPGLHQSGEAFEMVVAPVGLPDADGLKFSADGAKLMLRTREGGLYVARTDVRQLVPISVRFTEIPIDSPAVTADIAPDGSFVVVGEADNSLVQIDLTGDTPRSFDLPEHAAVVNQIAISPDRAKVAAASLDGRVRIVDLARERFVAGLPLAGLASHGQMPRMITRRLDDAPGTFPDTAFLDQQSGAREDAPAVIVFGSYPSLAAATAGVDTVLPAYRNLTDSGDAAVYFREGSYRAVFETSFGRAEAILQQVRELAPEIADAYVRVLVPWCLNVKARDGYKECGLPTPPAAADTKKGA
ncbi:WD40 repeat domain-containing protein [Mesorhizobium sp. GbtcB19]|uniref:WD40 repeat domain-containing protein n=1 Tax=Mesorhizobium sp. GbtcB19 TaxID=2824764 RepID=UPI001C2F5907|nr:hypothetical protein [Mesorhizobium sp. GbtcB19]